MGTPAEQAAVAACKQEVQTQATTSGSTKTQLEGVCAKVGRASSGDTAATGEVLAQLLAQLQTAVSH
jgi:hypothetical protein